MSILNITSKNKTIGISQLVFGTAGFSDIKNQEFYFELLDKYFELGGNCIDTARCYCEWIPDGKDVSEAVIGSWIKSRNNRSKIIISTKGGHPDRKHNTARLDRNSLESDLKRSLELLQTDYIDIYFLHRDDERVPVTQIMPTLHSFIQSGKVKFLGASNWRAERIAEANEYARKHNLTEFSVSQIMFSLADCSASDFNDNTLISMTPSEKEFYEKSKIPVMSFSSTTKGFFSKMLSDDELQKNKAMKFVNKVNLGRLARVKKYSDNTGLTPAQISLGFLTCNPIKTAAIFSVSGKEQLIDCMSALNLKISMKDIQFLEDGN